MLPQKPISSSLPDVRTSQCALISDRRARGGFLFSRKNIKITSWPALLMFETIKILPHCQAKQLNERKTPKMNCYLQLEEHLRYFCNDNLKNKEQEPASRVFKV